jgi:hypothetical protein
MPATFTIISSTKVPTRDPQRAGKSDYFILGKTDDNRSFTLTIPEEKFSDAAIAEYARQELATHKRLVNKVITL